MRKPLLFLLALLVAFQASWALAAPYCLHERTGVSTHFGHHQHEHEAAAVEASGDASVPESLLPGGDSDCAACHAATPAVVLSTPSTDPLPPVRERFIIAEPAAPLAPLALIERPSWPALA